MFVSFSYLSYPSVEEFNDLSYGKYGRYIIQDGKIKVELYMNKQYGMMYMYAKTTARGIQFYMSSATGMGGIFTRSRTTDGGDYRKAYTKFYN